jgi:DNA replication protein DnaC
MMMEQTFNQLAELRLHGMARALREQCENPASAPEAFEDRLAFIVDSEWSQRQQKGLERRLRQAKLRDVGCIEDVDHQSDRGLDKSVFSKLATCSWAMQRQNVLIAGPTGVGKTFLLCALAQKACRDGYTVKYHRVSRLADALSLARADGSLSRLLTSLAKTDVLALDDWGLSPLDAAVRYDLMEVIEDRHGNRSTLIASQLPVDAWHGYIGDPTLADAILDRLVHNAHRLNMRGPSRRKSASGLTEKDRSGKQRQ